MTGSDRLTCPEHFQCSLSNRALVFLCKTYQCLCCINHTTLSPCPLDIQDNQVPRTWASGGMIQLWNVGGPKPFVHQAPRETDHRLLLLGSWSCLDTVPDWFAFFLQSDELLSSRNNFLSHWSYAVIFHSLQPTTTHVIILIQQMSDMAVKSIWGPLSLAANILVSTGIG